MKYIIGLILCASLFFSLPVRAESSDPHEELVHFAAHVGTSYMISTMLFGFTHKAIGLTQNDSLEFSIFTTLVLGLVYKDMEAINNRSQGIPGLGKSMLYNCIGVTGTIFTVKAFEF